jgi:hypothetical protein
MFKVINMIITQSRPLRDYRFCGLFKKPTHTYCAGGTNKHPETVTGETAVETVSTCWLKTAVVAPGL